MNEREALEIIGGLSNPSKMPWLGYSIPAEVCKTGSKLRGHKNTVCSSCYAMKGFYPFKKVQEALYRRLESLTHPRWTEAMILVISKKASRVKDKSKLFFRWHDSGDLQSKEHLTNIVRIASSIPEVKFYLPTKEPRIVKEFLDNGESLPPNLFIKHSSPLIASSVHSKVGNLPYSTVGLEGPERFDCPASQQENTCGDCRMCWTNQNINYRLH